MFFIVDCEMGDGMTTVYFATNRINDGTGVWGYGAKVAPYDTSQITFAVADVTGIDLQAEGSGTINGITDKTPANFSAETTKAIVGTNKNLLIFVHGFDNSFEDAIKRSAFNREWFAATGQPGTDMTVVAFTWPSQGTLFAAPPHMPPDAYLTDQANAGRSGWHLAYFFGVIDQLSAVYRKANPTGRMVLLAHSMGNYALQGAIQTWGSSRPSDTVVFDDVVLAAADEVDDTFERPAGGRMTDLPKLTNRISVYYSCKDVAMYLSTTINLTARLGFDGPSDKRNAAVYTPKEFRIVDCTEVSDFDLLNPPDATHQYYRRSKIVRADIASVIANTAAGSGGLRTLS